jgi:hypothetical protein
MKCVLHLCIELKNNKNRIIEMKLKLIIAITICSLSAAVAQEKEIDRKVGIKNKLAISARLGSEDDLFPAVLGNLPTLHKISIRPRVDIGVEYRWRTGKHSAISQDLVVHYHRHIYQERNMGIGTNFSYRHDIYKKLNAGVRLGVHYSNSKATNLEYKYNTVTSTWEAQRAWFGATNRLYIPLGAELGYKVTPKINAVVGGRLALLLPHIKGLSPVNIYRGFYLGAVYALR